MKLLSNRNGKNLMVHLLGSFYSINIYKDFKNITELTEYLQDGGYISKKSNARKEYEFYYTNI